MSCICEFHTPDAESSKNVTPTNDGSSTTVSPKDAEPDELTEPSVANSAVSASELADCRTENWLLRKKLREYEVTIENLEQLVSTLVEKQHQILSDMFNLRTENNDLQSECHLQREYHSMERNALLKQLNDAQLLYQNRAETLESRSANRESPINSGSSFVASSDSEDHGEYGSDSNDSNDERESNCKEENEDLSADSLAPSSECSSPSPTCSESEDTDLEDDQSGENSTSGTSETD